MATPSDIKMVVLEGYVRDALNRPIPATRVYIRLKDNPTTKGNINFTRRTITYLTDLEGYFSVELPANTWIIVSVPSCNLQKTGLLPFTGTVSLTQLGD